MVWTKVTVSSYMYYYTVNLSPSVIIRDAVTVKWAVMQQTKRVTFTETCLLIFFLSFSKIFILAHYRDYTFGHSSSLQVIVDHCRSFLVLVTTQQNDRKNEVFVQKGLTVLRQLIYRKWLVLIIIITSSFYFTSDKSALACYLIHFNTRLDSS